MPSREARPMVLDTNCFIEAARTEAGAEALEAFVSQAAPRLWLSSVVAAELRAGTRTPKDRRQLERHVLGPYVRRNRVITPSAASWSALGDVLAKCGARKARASEVVPRSFTFDTLIAHSCREAGAILITANVRDMLRIRTVFAFDFLSPYPES